MADTIHIGILLFPEVTQLDATGPAQVLCRVPGAKLHMIWKTKDPVPTDAGFSIVPTTTFAANQLYASSKYQRRYMAFPMPAYWSSVLMLRGAAPGFHQDQATQIATAATASVTYVVTWRKGSTTASTACGTSSLKTPSAFSRMNSEMMNVSG